MKRPIFILMGLALATIPAWQLARAQAAPPDAGGVWIGTLSNGQGLELHLTQDGQALSGPGVIQQADPSSPLFLDSGGEINSAGTALLQLKGSPTVYSLEVNFGGDQASARLIAGDTGQSQSLTLTRRFQAPPPGAEQAAPKLWNNSVNPFERYSPTEVYRLDMEVPVYLVSTDRKTQYTKTFNFHMRFQISGALISEMVGPWNLEEQDDSRGVVLGLNRNLTFREGRVAAWNFILTPEYSRVNIKTPDTVSNLGDLVFPRISSGRAGDVRFSRRDTSLEPKEYIRLVTKDQLEGYPHGADLTVTLERP